jgi:hypothetical protein
VRTRLPVTFWKSGAEFTPAEIPGLALWLDASDASSLYTTDAGPVAAVSSPTDIAGCALWLDGADSSAASMTLNGSLVETWKDKSGNSRNFTSSGSARPTLTAAGQNGRSVVTLDGTDDSLTGPAGFSLTDTHTVLAVVKPDVRKIAGLLSGSVTQANLIYGDGSSSFSGTKFGAFGVGRAVYGGGAITTGSFQVFSAVLSGSTLPTNLSMFTNGMGGVATIETAGTAPGATMAANLLIGTTQVSQFWDGDIAEIILYPTALSTADRARVEAYLAQRWGISGVHAPATATSDPVGAWLDKSGNARHATQSTAGNRPKANTAGLNSRRAVQFFGGNSELLSLGNLSAVFPSAGEVLVAYSPTSDTSYGLYETRANSSYFRNANGLSYFGTFSTGRQGGISVSMPSSGNHVVSMRNDNTGGSNQVIRLDGAQVFAGASVGGYAAGDSHVLGNNNNAAADSGLTGYIGEVLAFPRILSTTERSLIERYLAARWGITLAPQVSNADAQDWVNRVYANGGTVSASTAASVNTLCDSLDAASLRDRFYRMNIFAGSNLNAALVPLYRGPSLGGTQYGNATDTNVSTLFVSANYSETTGLSTTVGGGQYLNTGLSPNDMALADVQAMHLAASHGPIASTDLDPRPIGAHGPSDRFSFVLSIRASATGQLGVALGKTNQLNSASIPSGAQASASWIGSRTSATSLVVYKNGTADATLATSVTGIAGHAFPFFVGRINNSGSPLGDSAALPHRHYSVGGGLTASQVLAYQSALAAFNTAMGRTA